jgi:DNA-binding response OmpR family regulator
LVVEDDAGILETLSFSLQYEGYKLLKARTVERACALLRERRPDLLLLDYMLQDDTAERVFVCARELYGHSLPVILLTAADDAEGKGRALGAEQVVHKPFDLESLLSVVERFVAPPVIPKSHSYLGRFASAGQV